MSGVVIPDPRGGHVWIYGVDSSGNPVKVLVDTSGHLQVDIVASKEPYPLATYHRQDRMIELLEQLVTLLGEK